MKRPSKVFAALLTISLLFVVGCSTAPVQAPANEAPTDMSLAASDPASTWYALGSGISKVLRETHNWNVSVEVTGSAVENVRLLQAGKVDLGFSASVVPLQAFTGRDGYEKHDKLRAVFGYAQSMIQLVARTDSDIHSIADLKGKRVAIGAPGSSTQTEALIALEAYGLKESDVQGEKLTFSESAKALKDRQIEAAFINIAVPAPAIMEIANSIPIRMIPVQGAEAEKIMAGYPSFQPTVIPKGTYKGVDEDVPTLGVQLVLLTRSDLPENHIYNLTKTLFEQQPELVKAHPSARAITAQNAVRYKAVPFHPGAERYYKEIGALQ